MDHKKGIVFPSSCPPCAKLHGIAIAKLALRRGSQGLAYFLRPALGLNMLNQEATQKIGLQAGKSLQNLLPLCQFQIHTYIYS